MVKALRWVGEPHLAILDCHLRDELRRPMMDDVRNVRWMLVTFRSGLIIEAATPDMVLFGPDCACTNAEENNNRW